MLMPNLVPQCQALQLKRDDFDHESFQKDISISAQGHRVQCCSEATLASLSLETTTYVILATFIP